MVQQNSLALTEKLFDIGSMVAEDIKNRIGYRHVIELNDRAWVDIWIWRISCTAM